MRFRSARSLRTHALPIEALAHCAGRRSPQPQGHEPDHRRLSAAWLRTWHRNAARSDPDLAGRRDRPHQVLEPTRRRARRVWSVSPSVSPAGGAARPVLRSRARERRDRAHDVRSFERVLRRSDREEAAQSLPARHARSVVRDRGLQPHVQILPELGHLQVARERHAGRCSLASGRRGRRGAARVPQRRVHVQRPGHLPRVRHRRGERVPRTRDQERRRHRGLRLQGASRGVLRAHGCGERRPQGVHRALLPPGL